MREIIIEKSNNADTRTMDKIVTKEELKKNTESHIWDVRKGCVWIAEQLVTQSKKHDYTKLNELDLFYKDFTSGLTGEEFKALEWWKIHMSERHHLNDSVPDDVNLIDVIEMVVDCCMAGMARSGYVYDVSIPDEVLQKAFKNTFTMLIDNIEVKDNERI